MDKASMNPFRDERFGADDHVYGKQPNAHVAAAMISARLDRMPPSRSGLYVVVLLSLGFFFELYGLLASGYLAPGLTRSGIFTMTTPGLFGTTGIASFMASLFFGLFCGTLVCGFLADRFGRRAVFVYSLLWFMATNVGMLFMNTAFAINCWRFLTGLGIGVEMVTIGTFLSEIAPKHLRGRTFAFCQTFGFLAVPIVAGISYLLVPIDPLGVAGWRCTAGSPRPIASCVTSRPASRRKSVARCRPRPTPATCRCPRRSLSPSCGFRLTGTA